MSIHVCVVWNGQVVFVCISVSLFCTFLYNLVVSGPHRWFGHRHFNLR